MNYNLMAAHTGNIPVTFSRIWLNRVPWSGWVKKSAIMNSVGQYSIVMRPYNVCTTDNGQFASGVNK